MALSLEQLSDQAFIDDLRRQIYKEAIELLIICIRTNGTLNGENVVLHRREFSRYLQVNQNDTAQPTIGDLILLTQCAIYEEPRLSHPNAQALGRELDSYGTGWYIMPVMNGEIVAPAWVADLPCD